MRSSHPLVVILCTLLISVGDGVGSNCQNCKQIVENFIHAVRESATDNFGGGNTQWEETRLGTYATSETRLVHLTDHLCDKFVGEKHRCHHTLELIEHELEDWWLNVFRHSQNSLTHLESDLCVERTKYCCAAGYFGADCFPCAPCSVGGYCDGNGTRSGTGACRCHSGYIGEQCSACDLQTHYTSYASELNANRCLPCHVSCVNGCRGPNAEDCVSCGKGWVLDNIGENAPACVDIDECANSSPCELPNQFCLNTLGSYECKKCDKSCRSCTGPTSMDCKDCAPGYQRSNNGGCEDINECSADSYLCRGDGQVCRNTMGAYECECKPGYKRSGESCIPTAQSSKIHASTKSSEAKTSGRKTTKHQSSDKIIWTVTFTKEFAKYFCCLALLGILCYIVKGNKVVVIVSSIFVGIYVYSKSLELDYIFTHQK